MVKSKKTKFKDFNFNLKNYLRIIKKALISPKSFAREVSLYRNVKNATYFLITNITLGLVILIINKIIMSGNPALIFPAISETLFLIPLGTLGLFGFGFLLHLGAKVFGGKADLRGSITAACFSSVPLIFAAVPFALILTLIWMSILMVLTFQKIHLYKIERAVINITIPFLLIMLGLIMLGILNPIQMYFKLANLESNIQAFN